MRANFGRKLCVSTFSQFLRKLFLTRAKIVIKHVIQGEGSIISNIREYLSAIVKNFKGGF